MGQAKEHYRARPMAADETFEAGGPAIAGFLAVTAGTITVTDANGDVLVNAAPLTAGAFTRIPLLFNTSAGGVVALGGGASGTLFV